MLTSQIDIIGEKPYIPDHKIYFVDFNDEKEAYFLCGLLNTRLVKTYIESHNISIQLGNIFKHMELPEFNSQDEKHLNLALLVKEAHDENDNLKREQLLNKINALGEEIIKSK